MTTKYMKQKLSNAELLQSRKFYNEMTLPPLNIFVWDNLNKCEANDNTLKEFEYRFDPNTWIYEVDEIEEEVIEHSDVENISAGLAWVRFGLAFFLLYLGIKLFLLS